MLGFCNLGYGGGYMEREEIVEYKERREESDDEYDEVGISCGGNGTIENNFIIKTCILKFQQI